MDTTNPSNAGLCLESSDKARECPVKKTAFTGHAYNAGECIAPSRRRSTGRGTGSRQGCGWCTHHIMVSRNDTVAKVPRWISSEMLWDAEIAHAAYQRKHLYKCTSYVCHIFNITEHSEHIVFAKTATRYVRYTIHAERLSAKSISKLAKAQNNLAIIIAGEFRMSPRWGCWTEHGDAAYVTEPQTLVQASKNIKLSMTLPMRRWGWIFKSMKWLADIIIIIIRILPLAIWPLPMVWACASAVVW